MQTTQTTTSTITTDDGEEVTFRTGEIDPENHNSLTLAYIADEWRVTWPVAVPHDRPGTWGLSEWIIDQMDLPEYPSDHAHVEYVGRNGTVTVRQFARVTFDEETMTWTVSIDKRARP